MTGRLPRRLLRWRWGIALALGLGCAGLGWQARRLSVDPSNRALFIRDDASYATYQAFRAAFGSDETVVIGLRLREGLSPEVAAWLARLTDALRTVPNVEAVQSLATARRLRRGWFGRLIDEPLLGPPGGEPLALEALQQRLALAPPDARALLSPDGSFTAVVLSISGDEADPLYRHALVTRLRCLLAERAHPSVDTLLSGTAVEQDAFIDRIGQDRRTLVPVTIAVITLLLVAIHREPRTPAYALAVMGGSLACVNGLMALSGTPLNIVSSLLAPLILIVSVSATIHLAHSFSPGPDAEDPAEHLASVYRRMFLPCALALGTTAIGFLSLLVSRVPAIRSFGLFGAIGTAIAWALSMLLAPAMAGLAARGRAGGTHLFEPVGRALAASGRRLRWAVVAASAVMLAGFLQLAPSVRASTDLLTSFPERDPFRQDTEQIQQRLGGLYPLELLVRVPDSSALREPAAWDALDRFQAGVRRLPGVSRVVSLTEVERYAGTVAGRPRSARWLSSLLQTWPRRAPQALARLASLDFRTLRVTALLRSSDTAQVMQLSRAIAPLAQAELPPGWRVDVTGQTFLLARMSQQLVSDEVASVGLAFAVILLVAWLGLRWLGDALVCLGVNALPVAGLFACMAALQVPLNTATAMIATIALGLMFDNTVYFVSRYRAARAGGAGGDRAVAMSLLHTAHPMIASSLILAGGFAVAALGRMTPTRQFGMLSCAVIGMALLSDLVLLPALLHLKDVRLTGGTPCG